MKVKDVMSRPVIIVPPDTSLQEAAGMMRNLDIGFLPVGSADKLVGVITDRDIACRAVAAGQEPTTTPIAHAISKGVIHCFDDQGLDAAARLMAQRQVHRLAVLNRAMQLVGIISVSDLARRAAHELTGEVVEAVSRNPSRTAARAGSTTSQAVQEPAARGPKPPARP